MRLIKDSSHDIERELCHFQRKIYSPLIKRCWFGFRYQIDSQVCDCARDYIRAGILIELGRFDLVS